MLTKRTVTRINMSLESKKTEQLLQLPKLKFSDAPLTAVGSYIYYSEDMSALWTLKYRH